MRVPSVSGSPGTSEYAVRVRVAVARGRGGLVRVSRSFRRGHRRRRAVARESNTVGGVAVSYLKGGHTWAWVEQ